MLPSEYQLLLKAVGFLNEIETLMIETSYHPENSVVPWVSRFFESQGNRRRFPWTSLFALIELPNESDFDSRGNDKG